MTTAASFDFPAVDPSGIIGAMSHGQAYLSGRWVSASELSIPIYDAGFVQGATVTEQLRTFGGRIFRLDAHLERLFRSLEIVEIDPGLTATALSAIAEEVVARNYAELAAGDDLGLGIFVTPGPYATLAEGVEDFRPIVCVHSFPLQFRLWANKFAAGERVVISDVEQISPHTWPTVLKCRSRMHYFLADRHAAAVEPGSRAILLDRHGFVSEATTANVLIYRAEEGLVSPLPEKILPGISLSVTSQLIEPLSIPLTYRDIRPDELESADEVLLTSTSVCALPVVRCNGQPIGDGTPGPIYGRLLAAWNDHVGLDIAEQARQFAARPSAAAR